MAWRPGRKGVICRCCKRHVSECGGLSARGKCEDCGTVRRIVQNLDMHTHSGYYHDKWRADMIRSAGGIVPQALLDRIESYGDANAELHA